MDERKGEFGEPPEGGETRRLERTREWGDGGATGAPLPPDATASAAPRPARPGPGPEAPPPSGPETEPARPRRKDPFWFKPVVYGLLLVASLIIGVQIFNFVIMPAFVGHRDEVTVPDLAGKDVETAEALLLRAGLKLGDTRQRHDARPAGTIVAQHPGAGSSVKGGRTVAVIVSRGEAAGVVPRLDGQSMRNARLELETAGLNLGEIVSIPSESVLPDVIIATEPSAGSTAPRGTPVNLLVSTGGSSRTYVMPDLRGRDASEVEISLREAGFTVEVADGGIRLFRGRRRVVDHQPAPGTRVTAASHITLHTD